jgi:hypothetical protein
MNTIADPDMMGSSIQPSSIQDDRLRDHLAP